MEATNDARALLDSGQLIPPVDDLTANGLEIWRDSPPLYHDLTCVSYTANDVREWSGRLRKYKAEVVSYTEKIRHMEREVAQLAQELANATGEFEAYEERIQLAHQQGDEMASILQEQMAKKNLAAQECNQIRKAREQLQKQKAAVEQDISQVQTRIGNLKTEVEHNRARHLAALGEKEKLKLERRWFFRERLLLEETTLVEIQDITVMKEKLEKLRHCLHKSWRDTKELDLLGHLRATKGTAYNDEWYKARRRTFHRTKTSQGSRYVDLRSPS